jgi:hypothetical protein
MEYDDDDDDCLANRSTPHKTLVYASFLRALEWNPTLTGLTSSRSCSVSLYRQLSCPLRTETSLKYRSQYGKQPVISAT